MLDRIRAFLACAVLMAAPGVAEAYTAAGDRTFPATILLPQIAPSDELYITPGTLPQSAGGRASSVEVNYDKTITERLGIEVGGGYSWLDQAGAPTLYGWQNVTAAVQYLAVQDPDHEFLLSVGAQREFGGTGALRIGASPLGATTPMVYFGKGMGDVAADYLRPFAISGFAGYTKSDGSPRPDLYSAGIAIEYSIPYLESKVRTLQLPDFLRSMTPIVEYLVTTPSGQGYGASTTSLVAPGVTYAGAGWEFAIEGQIPITRATGRGLGVIAQVHFSLDYFFPETIGRPLFGGP